MKPNKEISTSNSDRKIRLMMEISGQSYDQTFRRLLENGEKELNRYSQEKEAVKAKPGER